VTLDIARQVEPRWNPGTQKVVGATGFEPATPCAQGRCATRLRYAPIREAQLSHVGDSQRACDKRSPSPPPVRACNAYEIPGSVYLFDLLRARVRRSSRRRFEVRTFSTTKDTTITKNTIRVLVFFATFVVVSTSETNAERDAHRLWRRVRKPVHRPSKVRVEIPIHASNGDRRKWIERL
jgi:hypothetical protein